MMHDTLILANSDKNNQTRSRMRATYGVYRDFFRRNRKQGRAGDDDLQPTMPPGEDVETDSATIVDDGEEIGE